MTQSSTSNKASPATQPPSPRRATSNTRSRILRITACLILAHALATTTAILLSVQQLSRNPAAHILIERLDDNTIIERGTLYRLIGLDRYNLILRPTPFDPTPPPIITHDLSRHRYLEHTPRWVRTKLPGHGSPHIPDTIHAAGVNNIAIGWPLRMYRATEATWTDEAHREAFLNASGTLQVSHIPADTPFACPIIHGTVGLVSTGPYLGQTHWGSINTFEITNNLPTFITNHLKLPPQLPITPIWLGTLINTLLFATLIALTHKALTTLCHHIHKKRHPAAIPCPNCRYDLKGLTTPQCPECGQQVPE